MGQHQGIRKAWMRDTPWWNNPEGAPTQEEWEKEQHDKALSASREKLTKKLGRAPTAAELKAFRSPPKRKCCGRR